MEKFFLEMSRTWESFDMSDQHFLATGETAVVLTTVAARARVTGRELAFPILQELRTRDGRITEVRPFYWDTAAVARACSV
jgi:ketosteroid isomerase-like protein